MNKNPSWTLLCLWFLRCFPKVKRKKTVFPQRAKVSANDHIEVLHQPFLSHKHNAGNYAQAHLKLSKLFGEENVDWYEEDNDSSCSHRSHAHVLPDNKHRNNDGHWQRHKINWHVEEISNLETKNILQWMAPLLEAFFFDIFLHPQECQNQRQLTSLFGQNRFFSQFLRSRTFPSGKQAGDICNFIWKHVLICGAMLFRELLSLSSPENQIWEFLGKTEPEHAHLFDIHW